jgi:hypothetical protein
MLGYGRQSDQQVDALVHASLDENGEVRNNAVRALEVLASRSRSWLNGFRRRRLFACSDPERGWITTRHRSCSWR